MRYHCYYSHSHQLDYSHDTIDESGSEYITSSQEKLSLSLGLARRVLREGLDLFEPKVHWEF